MTGARDPPKRKLNFSRAFVTHLHKRGYAESAVRLHRALDSFPGATDWKQHGGEPTKMHKYSTQDDFTGENRQTTVLGRASKNRVVAKPYAD